MGLIIRPDGRPLSQVAADADRTGPVGQDPGQIRIPAIEIPKPLHDDLTVNPHLVPQFRAAVGKALSTSLQHPLTRPRILSAEVLRERAETCYGVLVILRRDMKWPLKKCFDVLPQQFMHALLRGTRAEDEALTRADGSAWNRGAPAGQVELNKRAAQDEDDEEYVTEEAVDEEDDT